MAILITEAERRPLALPEPRNEAEPALVRPEDEVGRFDHAYIGQIVALRWAMTAAYPGLVLLGLIPMNPLALVGSASWLTLTSVLATWYWRRGRPIAWYDASYLFLDSLSVSFGVLAAASLAYPIWLTYMMLMIEGSAERSTRFAVVFNLWCIVAYLACAGILTVEGWFSPSRGSVAVTSAMMLFIGMDLTVTFDAGRRLRAYIRRMAVTDPLTGLANRRRLTEALGRGAPTDRAIAVAVMDVDDFKGYNDAFGHLAGDRLLVGLACSLEAEFPDAQTIARYGGDEFVVLFPCETADAAARRVQDLLDRGRLDPVPVSIGLAVWPHDGPALDSALAAADDCLRAAKRRHKGALVTAQH